MLVSVVQMTKGDRGLTARLDCLLDGSGHQQPALLASRPVLFGLFSRGFENLDVSLTRFAPYCGPFLCVSLYLWPPVGLHPSLPPPPVSGEEKKKKACLNMEHMCFPAGLLSRDWGNRNCHWPSVPLPSHLAPLLAPAWVRCTQNSPSGAGLFSNFHLFWLLCFFGVRFTRL